MFDHSLGSEHLAQALRPELDSPPDQRGCHKPYTEHAASFVLHAIEPDSAPDIFWY